jgi:hypothetical protein
MPFAPFSQGFMPALQGFGSRLHAGIAANPATLSALGGAMMANRQDANNPLFGQPGMIADAQTVDYKRAQMEQELRKEEQRKRATVSFLQSKKPGMPPEYYEAITSDPTILAEFLRGEVYPDKGEAIRPTDDMREWDWAMTAPSEEERTKRLDFLKRGGTNINIGGEGYKVPAGYMPADPADPSKGVVAIPGGPATEIPGEQAARVGMAESFLEDIPGIKTDIGAGKTTGPIDWAAGKAGIGEAGRVRARIESGVDALQRSLTGAGMPASEAATYARRYLPGPLDDAKIAADKLAQLEKELKRISDVLQRGRKVKGSEGGWTEVEPGISIRKRSP